MKYLLDTHIFLWWITDNTKLQGNTRDLISDKSNELFLSSASLWEMMIKSKLNKIDLPDDPKSYLKDQVEINSINILNITMEHSLETYDLPEIHKDPFDRMLIAQARVEKLTILTTDSFIKRYEVNTLY
jgi:PIN domain nuclease of toxin-antitoxin system